MADCPEGEGGGDFFLFLLFFFFLLDYGDDFAETSACVAGAPGEFDLGVQAGPDFGFVVLEVGHEVVPCCGGAEGFD